LNKSSVIVRLVFIVLASLSISTMVNAPGIGYGYGLVILAMIIASWMFDPKESFIYLLISHTIATFIAVETKSAFLTVFLLSNILRPILASLGSLLRRRYGRIYSSLILVALDSLLALSIAITYYGDDGIHSAFSIYEFVWIPFAYIVYESIKRDNKILGIITSLIVSALYILSIFAFMSIAPLLASIAGLLILFYAFKRGSKTGPYYISVILITALGLALGGLPIKLNSKVMFYPLFPKSWSSSRWSVQSLTCENKSNVFIGVHDPSRLRIVRDCISLIGRVKASPIRFDDGDYCFDLKVINSSYPISIGGHILRHGYVHVEIIPKDQARLLKEVGGGICPGDLVEVTGVYVVDTDHGLWSEIHPVFNIEVINRTSSWPQCIWDYVQKKAIEYSSSK
jgi:hypothetical protein